MIIVNFTNETRCVNYENAYYWALCCGCKNEKLQKYLNKFSCYKCGSNLIYIRTNKTILICA